MNPVHKINHVHRRTADASSHVASRQTPRPRPAWEDGIAMQAAAALPQPPPPRRRHAAAHHGCPRLPQPSGVCFCMQPGEKHQSGGRHGAASKVAWRCRRLRRSRRCRQQGDAMRQHIKAAPDCRSCLAFVSAWSQERNTRAAAAVELPAWFYGNAGGGGAPAAASNKVTPCGITSRLPSTAAAVWRLFLHGARRGTPERRPPLSCQQGCMALQAAVALPHPPPPRRSHETSHQGCPRLPQLSGVCFCMEPGEKHQSGGRR